MQRSFISLAILMSLSMVQARLMAAQKWCVANYPDAVFREGWNWYCPSPSFMPGHDMAGDGYLEDFGLFQTCLSSAQFVDPPTIPCRCANLGRCANLDGDVNVDSADFVIFASCLSGPGIAADKNCVN